MPKSRYSENVQRPDFLSKSFQQKRYKSLGELIRYFQPKTDQKEVDKRILGVLSDSEIMMAAQDFYECLDKVSGEHVGLAQQFIGHHSNLLVTLFGDNIPSCLLSEDLYIQIRFSIMFLTLIATNPTIRNNHLGIISIYMKQIDGYIQNNIES